MANQQKDPCKKISTASQPSLGVTIREEGKGTCEEFCSSLAIRATEKSRLHREKEAPYMV